MNCEIRKMTADEYPLLEKFLYLAIFIPDGVEPPPYDIIFRPELQVYTKDFGSTIHDTAFVAVCDNTIAGAVWVRIMDDYGHIDDETPSLAISLLPEYRGQRMGTKLMQAIIDELKERDYKQISLAVQKANYAVKMYRKVGFEAVDENAEEYIMVCKL